VSIDKYRDFIRLSFTQFALICMQLLFSIFTTRYFSPQAFGSYAASLALIGVVGIGSQLGLGNAAARIDLSRKNDAAGLFWFSMKIGLAGIIFTMICAYPWSVLWKNPGAQALILLLAPTILFSTATNVLIGFSLKRERYRFISAARALAGTTALLFSLFVIHIWHSALSIVSFPFFVSLFTFLLMSSGNFELIHKIPKDYELHKNLKFALLSLRTSVIRYSSGTFPIFLLARYFNANLLGNWNRGVTFIQVPVEQVINSMKSITYSKYAELSDDPKTLSSNLRRILETVSIVVFPVTMALIPVLPIIFEVVFPDHWSYLSQISQIFLASTAIMIIYNLTESCLEAANHQDICFRAALLSAISTFSLSFISLLLKNWEILAAVTVLSPLFGHMCQLILWKKQQEIDLAPLLKKYVLSLLIGGLLFTLITELLSWKFASNHESIYLVSCLIVTAAAYIYQVRKSNFRDILSIIKIPR